MGIARVPRHRAAGLLEAASADIKDGSRRAICLHPDFGTPGLLYQPPPPPEERPLLPKLPPPPEELPPLPKLLPPPEDEWLLLCEVIPTLKVVWLRPLWLLLRRWLRA